MKSTYKKFRKRCLGCNNKKIFDILDLGYHSFADRFVKKKDLSHKDPTYPLILTICKKCKFIQSKFITNPKDRYFNYDYSYTASNSKYSINHWSTYSNFLNTNFKVEEKKIVEIGSNDGVLSLFLKNKGAKSTCIDASPFMTKISKKKGLKSFTCIFSFKQSKKIKKKINHQDIVIANNVFNHADKPSDFLKGVSNLLKDDGLFIFEQPYFLSTLTTKKFDQIYHEHVSYFTVTNLYFILKQYGFQIIKILKNEYHGGSLRIVAKKNKNERNKYIKTIKNYLKKEKDKEIYNLVFYKKYFSLICKNKERLLKKINTYRFKNYKIFGVGAGAKTNTFLTFNELNNFNIDGITDASKFKINKYTPLTRIKIFEDKILKNFDKIAVIILSWNIEKLLKNKLKKLNKNIKFIKL